MRYWEAKGRKRRVRRRSAASNKRTVTSGGSLRSYPFLRAFYQHQAVVGDRLQKFLFFLVIATILYAFVFGDAGLIRIMALEHEKATIQGNLAMLDNEIESLKFQIDRLKTDPYIMEKLGRERYGYVYPGDRVYKIINPGKSR